MEYISPLIAGIFLAYFLARWAYKNESTKFRKISLSIVSSIFGLLIPFIVMAFIVAKDEPQKKDDAVIARLSSYPDGCPLDMKREIKKLMNYPDSFKCIETNLIKRKDDYVLIMQFSGKNQFGEAVNNVAKAEYNSDGKFIKFID